MNPDLHADIEAGKSVLTTYFTSGDGGGQADWEGREASVLDAQAAMANVASTWSCAPRRYAQKRLTRCSLLERPNVSALFVRLPDESLSSLWQGRVATLTTVDSADNFTRAELLSTLAAVNAEHEPSKVGMLDSTFAHGYDHEDHIASSLFTLQVARSDGMLRELVMYRGYSIHEPPWINSGPAPEPANLDRQVYAEKRRIMTVYNGSFPDTDIYNLWCQRFYPISSLTSGPAQLRSARGLCLQASGMGDGVAVTLAACNPSPAQTFRFSGDGRVLGSGDTCLSVDGNERIVLSACTGALHQNWTLMDNGQLIGSTAECLTAQGSTVSSTLCDSDRSRSRFFPVDAQRWAPL